MPALASIKLPSTERCSPCTRPAATPRDTTSYYLLKEMLKQIRSGKTTFLILREGGVVRNLVVETKSGEPAPCQMHMRFFDELALACNPI